MAGHHLPGDPYFPNHGNQGWIVEDPEEDPEEDSDEEPFEDSESSGTDTEPQVCNPGIHPHTQEEAIPIPEWGQYINHWSRQDGQRPPYGMQQGFYNVSEGGAADRALPVIVNRIARQFDQSRMSINRILEVNAAAQANAADILRLDEMQDDTQHHTEALQRQLNAAESEIRGLREHQDAQERRWKSQDEAKPSNRRSNRRK